MRRLALIAAALACLACPSHGAETRTAASQCANGVCRDDRPLLRYWARVSCGACRRFDIDYATDPAFRAAINSRFRLQGINADCPLNIPPGLARGIRCVPTFERADTHERFEGYRDKATLLQQLGLSLATPPDAAGPPAAPPDTSGTAATATPGDAGSMAPVQPDPLAPLRGEIAQLKSLAAGQSLTLDQLRAALDAALARRDITPEQASQLVNSSATTADQLAQLRAAVADVRDQLTAPPARVTPDTLPPGTLPAESDADPSAARPGLHIGRIVLTVGEIAGMAALAYATGGTGALAWKLGGMALAYVLRRRRTPAAGSPATQPSLPGTTAASGGGDVAQVQPPFQPTNFAPYPVDRVSAAFDWSKKQIVQRYPGSADLLHVLDSMMQQHLAGQAVGK